MANEIFDWDAFIKFDPELHVPVTGYDTQGVAAEEVGWPRPYKFGEEGSDRATDLAAYYDNCRSPNQAIEALWVPQHNHPFTHNRVVGEIVESDNGYLHGWNPAGSGLRGFPTSMPPSSVTSNPLVLNSAINGRLNSPTSALNPKPCVCIVCNGIGSFDHPMTSEYQQGKATHHKEYQCRFPGCPARQVYFIIRGHELSHYRENDQYQCKEETYNFTTKRFSDFKRHVGSKHCTSPANRFPCSVLWCKYSGSNGFARKDKLKSHYNAVHAGKVGPCKANKVIKPKASGEI